MYFLFICLLIIAGPLLICAQVSVSNQLEVSNWEQFDRTIFENWLDVSYQHEYFRLGVRHEINSPPDPFVYPLDSLLQHYDLTYRYLEFSVDAFRLTIGNYYTMFGRGLALRTYEDRNLRIDTNLEGLKLNYSGSFIEATALTGRMRDRYNRRDDRLWGIDIGLRVADDLLIGGSYLKNDFSSGLQTDLYAFRLEPNLGPVNIYAEMARPANIPNWSGYAVVSYTHPRFSLLIEYKNYNNLALTNRFLTEYNAPPAGSREHSFTLLNRHPHVLNMNNERGFQIEALIPFSQSIETTLNYSFTESQSRFKLFEEYLVQAHYDTYQNWAVEGIMAWNFDRTSGTENITPILSVDYSWKRIHTIHAEIQHQHVTNLTDRSEYDDDVLVVEYTRAPWLNFAVVGEYSNRYQLTTVTDDTKYWIYVQCILNILKDHQFSILYGKRQAGFVCAGGVCRFEPEFDGLELKLLSRF
jgi:hypothetical protein